MNLFFIHTPFQLLIAQNLIDKLNLRNNVFIAGINGNESTHFYKMYEVLVLDKFWNKIERIDNINDNLFAVSNPLKSFFKLLRFSSKIESLIRKYNTEEIFMGDINCHAYLFIYSKYKGTYRISFFEEGISHYVASTLKKRFDSGFLISIKRFVTNVAYNLAGVRKFADIVYATQEVILHDYKKYSIIPYKDNTHVKFSLILSDKIKAELDKIIQDSKIAPKPRLLYLSTSATSTFISYQDEVKYLVDYINANCTDEMNIYVKFHPKDRELKKQIVLDLFNKEGLNCIELFKDLSLPIELLYLNIEFKEIVAWESSSFFYSRMIIPNIKRTTLLPSLIRDYKKLGEDVNFFETYLKEIQEVSFNLFGERINEF